MITADVSAAATVALKPSAKVELPCTKDLPRKLVFACDSCGEHSFHAYCHVFMGHRSIAYAGAHNMDEVRLSYMGTNPVLWLRYAQFDLTESEAAEVERVFEPVGLQIERQESQS